MSCTITGAFLWLLGSFVIYKILDKLIRIPKLGSQSSRHVFITGCDTGFGYELAKILDNKGCPVFAGCLTEKGETELRKVCSNRLKTVSLDVTKQDSVTKAYEAVKAMLPPGKGLWGLVNNAGITGKMGAVEWLSSKDYADVLAVNVLGMIDVTRMFIPLLKITKGRVINTSSVRGRFVMPLNIPYSVSKHAVEAYSDGLRRQLKEIGITVHILQPGVHKTDVMSAERYEHSIRTAWEDVDENSKVFGEDTLNRYIANIKNSMAAADVKSCMSPPSVVARVYDDVLFTRYPRARYVVGNDAKIQLFYQLLPEWVGDWYAKRKTKVPIPRG